MGYYKNKKSNYKKRELTKEEKFEKMLKDALKLGNDKSKEKSKQYDKKVKSHKYIVKKEVKEDNSKNNNNEED